MVDLLEHSKISLYYATKSELQEVRIAWAAATGSVEQTKDWQWETLLRIGINPLELPKKNTKSPYDSTVGSHPIPLASALQDVEPELAHGLIERIKEDTLFILPVAEGGKNMKGAKEGDWYTGNASYNHGPRQLTPDPPKIESRCDRASYSYFYAQHAAWYTPQALHPIMEQHVASYNMVPLLTRLRTTIGDTETGAKQIIALATKHICRALAERAKPSAYKDLAKAVRFADPLAIKGALKDASPVYTFVLAFMGTPTASDMARGLSTLVRSWPAGLSHLARCPTLEELNKLRGPQLEIILRDLPWALLEPLIKEHEAEVRGLLIGFTNLELARLCLIDHKHRAKWDPEPFTGDERLPWAPYKAGITAGYAGLRQYREAAELAGIPIEGAAHLLHAQWTGRETHKPALEWLERYPELAPVLAACPAPYEVRTPGEWQSIQLGIGDDARY